MVPEMPKTTRQTGQASLEYMIAGVAFLLVVLALLGVFSNMHLKLWADFHSYELAFCAAFKTPLKCQRETREKLKPFVPDSNLQLKTQASMKGKKGKVYFEGLFKKKIVSESEFLYVP